MPHIAQLFFKTAVVFFVIEMVIGLQFGITNDFDAFVAHAQMNLLGWVSSAIFGGYYALNRLKAERQASRIHFAIYNAGLSTMFLSLYVKRAFGWSVFDTILSVSLLPVALGILIFCFVVFSADEEKATVSLASIP